MAFSTLKEGFDSPWGHHLKCYLTPVFILEDNSAVEQTQPEQFQPSTQAAQLPAQVPPEPPIQQLVTPVSSKKFPWKIIVLILFVLLLIGGVVYAIWAYRNDYFPFQKPTTLDCGQDFDCFIQASQDCRLAKMGSTVTLDILGIGIQQTTTSLLEIRGVEKNKCTFYIRTENIDLEFPPTVSPETVNQQREIYETLEGREGICKFDTSELTSMFVGWKQGNLSTEDFEVAECQGNYFDQSL